MHTGGEVDDVVHILCRTEYSGELLLSPERNPRIALGDGLHRLRPRPRIGQGVRHDDAQRPVVGDDLPRRAGGAQRIDQPLRLFGAQDPAAVGGLPVIGLGSS